MAQPLCKYFNSCGGCSAQHLDYSVQLENKKNSLANAIHFKEIAVYSGHEYFYRNRMDLIFHQNGIGFRKKGQWQRIIDIEKCVISNHRLNEIIGEIRGFFRQPDYFDIIRHTGTLRYAVVRTPEDDSSVSFVLNSGSTNLKEAVDSIKKFAQITVSNNVVVTYVPPNTDVSVSEDFFVVKGSHMLREKLLQNRFMYPVQGFFQNNHEVAEQMHLHCRQLLEKYDAKDAVLIDLYGGVGAFAINNAGFFKEALIVESSKAAIEAAEINIKNNGILNVKTMNLDAKDLKKADVHGRLFVVTDPPRSGMHPRTIEHLNAIKPDLIVYISCNVPQLGKDLYKFKGYTIKSAALFDLFPQTNHCEAVVELVNAMHF